MPEKWKQTATLCPLDWSSNYSLLRLWHVPKDLDQFVDQLNQQMTIVICSLVGRLTTVDDKFTRESSTSYRLTPSLTTHDGAILHHVKQLQIWQPMQLADHSPTASNTVPPQKRLSRLHHSTNIQLLTKILYNLIKTHFSRT